MESWRTASKMRMRFVPLLSNLEEECTITPCKSSCVNPSFEKFALLF